MQSREPPHVVRDANERGQHLLLEVRQLRAHPLAVPVQLDDAKDIWSRISVPTLLIGERRVGCRSREGGADAGDPARHGHNRESRSLGADQLDQVTDVINDFLGDVHRRQVSRLVLLIFDAGRGAFR